MSEYTERAEKFLADNGLRLRATFKGDKCPPWCGEDGRGHVHGDRYRVTISRKAGGRVSFDFWNSLHDMQQGNAPTAYDVLACISGDIYAPETFEDYCTEYGFNAGSRQAERDFRRLSRLAARLRAFFTDDEQESLSEIQ